MKHAKVVRRIIDLGWTSEAADWVHISSPFKEIRQAIIDSGAEMRSERVDAYTDFILPRPDFDYIVDMVNQADLNSEPPIPHLPELPKSQPPAAKSKRKHESGNPYTPTHNAPPASTLVSADVAKLAALTKPSKPRTISLLPAWESEAPPPARDWIVTDLITKGSLSIVFGKEGSKKTYAMLDLAVCIAMGKPWLEFETQQTAALWVDEESGRERWWARRFQAMTAHKSPKDIKLASAVLQRFNLRREGEAYQLGELILQAQAGLVVIDALMDVVPGADENAVRDMAPVLRDLRTLSEATGAAIIVIHHTNKVGGIRGSSAIPGQVDLTLKVDSPPDTNHIEFESGKTRDIPETRFAAKIRFEPEGREPERVWLEAAELNSPSSNGGISKAGRYVLAYLRAHGESGRKEIMEAATNGVTSNQARKATHELIDLRMIARVNKGGKGVTAVDGLLV